MTKEERANRFWETLSAEQRIAIMDSMTSKKQPSRTRNAKLSKAVSHVKLDEMIEASKARRLQAKEQKSNAGKLVQQRYRESIQ